jgi:hypothetical protein
MTISTISPPVHRRRRIAPSSDRTKDNMLALYPITLIPENGVFQPNRSRRQMPIFPAP